jgi:hypothetical protein
MNPEVLRLLSYMPAFCGEQCDRYKVAKLMDQIANDENAGSVIVVKRRDADAPDDSEASYEIAQMALEAVEYTSGNIDQPEWLKQLGY